MPSLTFLYSIYNKLTIKSSYYHGFAHNFHHSITETFLYWKIKRVSNLSIVIRGLLPITSTNFPSFLDSSFKKRPPTTTTFDNGQTVSIYSNILTLFQPKRTKIPPFFSFLEHSPFFFSPHKYNASLFSFPRLKYIQNLAIKISLKCKVRLKHLNPSTSLRCFARTLDSNHYRNNFLFFLKSTAHLQTNTGSTIQYTSTSQVCPYLLLIFIFFSF